MTRKIALIIGAGPAGLTAAYELCEKSNILPIVLEKSSDIGGLSKTVNYKGNLIDIGGHRFFSKSDYVMKWWQNILPLQGAPSIDDIILKRNIILSDLAESPDPEKTDNVMLIRHRLSRILFNRHLYDYPISLNFNTLKNFGLFMTTRIIFSYLMIKIFPQKEKSLEDFFINRFGKQLYQMFFKDYTEKVWGMAPSEIEPEWGTQRIKGLSISKIITNAIRKFFLKKASIAQKEIETSLISHFCYPKLGPGQLWEEVARQIKNKGGKILLNNEVLCVNRSGSQVNSVTVKNNYKDITYKMNCDYMLSTMPIKELIEIMSPAVPNEVARIAKGLIYRDFITVGVLLNKLKIKNESKVKTINNIIPDNWIYIQEREVKLGRLQIFNNWSPYLVRNPNTIWLGLEYFCDEGDDLWSMSDEEFAKFAIRELAYIEIIEKKDVLDYTVIRMPKAYPAYFGTYSEFDIIKDFLNTIQNLFLVGRNGMHKYNNTDHSMLSSITAVNNILNGITSKENIWQINVDEQYHEE
ncbi:MAG: NAD(P)/FAD-dependent oxidoreductase [Bacteroidales bacterium]|nr:NAD(P)/FAD-dependent oxidoreductase [Bacteroidales bacterium]